MMLAKTGAPLPVPDMTPGLFYLYLHSLKKLNI